MKQLHILKTNADISIETSNQLKKNCLEKKSRWPSDESVKSWFPPCLVSVLAATDAREKGLWRTNDGVCVAISSRGSRLINEQSRAGCSCDVCGGGRAGGVQGTSVCLAAVRAETQHERRLHFLSWAACFQWILQNDFNVDLPRVQRCLCPLMVRSDYRWWMNGLIVTSWCRPFIVWQPHGPSWIIMGPMCFLKSYRDLCSFRHLKRLFPKRNKQRKLEIDGLLISVRFE